MIPGEVFIKDEPVICNEGREITTITVVNTGDRPIQVGSHFHFFEVNKKMAFDRAKAFGKRLNIIASTAVRFEPGEEKEVQLVPFAGEQTLYGHNDLAQGDKTLDAGVKRMEDKEFKNTLS